MCDMKFRARPLIVDAIPCFTALQAARTNWGDLPEWFNKLYEDGGIMFLQRTIHVMTVGGWVAAQPEDWIIQGMRARYSPAPARPLSITTKS